MVYNNTNLMAQAASIAHAANVNAQKKKILAQKAHNEWLEAERKLAIARIEKDNVQKLNRQLNTTNASYKVSNSLTSNDWNAWYNAAKIAHKYNSNNHKNTSNRKKKI